MDFKNEETALQYLGTQLGVTVELTPNFTPSLQAKASNTAGLYCLTVVLYVSTLNVKTSVL